MAINSIFVTCGILWIFLFVPCKGVDLTISLENGNPAPATINVIENTRLSLYCFRDSNPIRIVWRKEGDANFEIFNTNLTISSIQTVHGGFYNCSDEVSGLAQSITIRILYPPDLPIITGPIVVEKETTFTLECTANSSPSSTIYWSESSDTQSQVLARGSSYTHTLTQDYFNIFCWAENTMFPTLGEPVTIALYQTAFVTGLQAAYIWQLATSNTYNVSTDIMVECLVSGSPYPQTWWTKDGDSSFRYDGETLLIRNVQLNFTGYYSCHTQNTLRQSGQPERTMTDVKHTLITINDPGIPEVCRGPCQVLVNDALDNCPCGTTPVVDPCESGSNNGLIAAAVVGWIIAVLLIVVFLFCCIKHRDEIGKRADTNDNGTTRMQLHKPERSSRPVSKHDERLASRPVLPVRPDVSRKIDDQTYSYVTGEETERRPIPATQASGKYDYLVPRPSVMGHDYLELEAASHDRPEGAGTEDVKLAGISNPTNASFTHAADEIKDNSTIDSGSV